MIELKDIKFLKVYPVQVSSANMITPKILNICAPSGSSAKRIARAYVGELMRKENKYSKYKISLEESGKYKKVYIHKDMIIDIAQRLEERETEE